MPDSSLISIIIPCYGQAHYLPDALYSVLNQSYPLWECIIVNDGSPDHTRQIAEEWMERDKRFQYIEKTNGGLSSARNAGLVASGGRYIQFLDADDLIHPDKFKRQVELMRSMDSPAVSYTDYFPCEGHDFSRLVPERYMSPKFLTSAYLKEITENWETGLSIPVHCFLFDAKIFREYRVKFDESLPNHEDWDCWMQVFALYPTVRFLDEKLAIYRIRTDGMCYDYQSMRHGFLKAINKQKKLFVQNRGLNKLLEKKEKGIRYIYRDVGIYGRLLKYVPHQIRLLFSRFIPIRIQRKFD